MYHFWTWCTFIKGHNLPFSFVIRFFCPDHPFCLFIIPHHPEADAYCAIFLWFYITMNNGSYFFPLDSNHAVCLMELVYYMALGSAECYWWVFLYFLCLFFWRCFALKLCCKHSYYMSLNITENLLLITSLSPEWDFIRILWIFNASHFQLVFRQKL